MCDVELGCGCDCSEGVHITPPVSSSALYPGIHTIVYLLTIVFICLCAGPGVGANDFRCPEEFGYYQVIVEIFL